VGDTGLSENIFIERSLLEINSLGSSICSAQLVGRLSGVLRRIRESVSSISISVSVGRGRFREVTYSMGGRPGRGIENDCLVTRTDRGRWSGSLSENETVRRDGPLLPLSSISTGRGDTDIRGPRKKGTVLGYVNGLLGSTTSSSSSPSSSPTIPSSSLWSISRSIVISSTKDFLDLYPTLLLSDCLAHSVGYEGRRIIELFILLV